MSGCFKWLKSLGEAPAHRGGFLMYSCVSKLLVRPY